MREIRTSGSEGGGTEINRSFLPLSYLRLRRTTAFRFSKTRGVRARSLAGRWLR